MGDLKKILTTVIIVMGTIYLVNNVPTLRHIIRKETTWVNGRIVQDPLREYISPR